MFIDGSPVQAVLGIRVAQEIGLVIHRARQVRNEVSESLFTVFGDTRKWS